MCMYSTINRYFSWIIDFKAFIFFYVYHPFVCIQYESKKSISEVSKRRERKIHFLAGIKMSSDTTCHSQILNYRGSMGMDDFLFWVWIAGYTDYFSFLYMKMNSLQHLLLYMIGCLTVWCAFIAGFWWSF